GQSTRAAKLHPIRVQQHLDGLPLDRIVAVRHRIDEALVDRLARQELPDDEELIFACLLLELTVKEGCRLAQDLHHRAQELALSGAESIAIAGLVTEHST